MMNRGRSFFLILFLFTVFSIALLQGMLDPDLFWHIRGGLDILEKGKIVLADSWNYLYEGKVWVNQQWLVEVILALLYKIGGISAIFYFKGVIAALAAFFIIRSVDRKDPVIPFLTAGIIIILIARYFLMRTQLFSFIFLAALIFLLEKSKPSKRILPILILFALWANIHAFFGLGLLVLGVHTCTVLFIDFLKDKKATVVFEKENLISAVSIPLCAFVTLINPFGIKIWQTAGSLFSQRQETLVSEWLPVWKYPVESNLMFFIYFGLLIFLGVVFSNKIKLRHLAISIPLVIFGFYSVRILPFSVVATAPLFASLLEGLFETSNLEESRLKRFYPYALVFLIALSMGSLSYRVTKPVTIPDRVYREDYPVGAVSYLKENGLKGKIWNEFDWGGFIVFSSKDFKTAIDGRTAVLLFPPGYLEEWRDNVNAKPGWRERLEKGSPDFILLYQDDFLAMELAQGGDWQLLYSDEISALFGRKSKNPAINSPH
jgi:hypothetical protein